MRYALHVFAVVVLLGAVLFIADGYTFSATGRVVSEWDVDSAVQNLAVVRQEYNLNLENVPNFVKSLFGNERINLTIARQDGSVVSLGLVTRDGRMEMLGTEELDDYTMDVQAPEAAIEAITSADDQPARLKQALDTGEIRYQARTFKTAVKVAVSRMVLSVVAFF